MAGGAPWLAARVNIAKCATPLVLVLVLALVLAACAKSSPSATADAGPTAAAAGSPGASTAVTVNASPDVPIERRAAAAASQVDVRECKTKNEPSGPGRIALTFAPSGEVTEAIVKPPYADTATGTCVAQKYRKLRMPRFAGEPVRVPGAFVIP